MSAIKGGLEFIAKVQRGDGGFWEYRWDGGKLSQKYRTTFATSLIMLALKDVVGSDSIKDKSARFLLLQKSPAWSWNYWARSSQMAKQQPYPEDLDDTFLALSALWFHDQTLLTPEVMADIAHLLFATEVTPGGPYRTWLVDDTADAIWQDVDLVVNANIGYFLRLQGVELSELKGFLEQAILKNELQSPYYPSLQPAMYFLARAYKGKAQGTLRQHILAQQDELLGQNPHQTALTITALLQLGYPATKLKEAINYLKKTQASDGSWQVGPMCIGPHSYPSCSPGLTTALCIEALVQYSQAIQTTPQREQESLEYRAVIQEIEATIADISHSDLKSEITTQLEQMKAYDKDQQIVLLPWLVARSFNIHADKATLHGLARTSMWGWIAYTIYDDFLDGEGRPKALPAALYATRQLLSNLATILPVDREFQCEIDKILQTMDGASAWEIAHCRGKVLKNKVYISSLPNYGDFHHLAHRSLGHTIAGLGVLYSAGIAADDMKMKALRDFFHHYLIARQLNDDAHDWEEDLRSGHVNSVGALILKKWIATGNNLAGGIEMRKKKQLQLILWDDGVITEVCQYIRYHITAAREALLAVGLQDVVPLLKLLQGPENAAKKAEQTRLEAIEFINAL